MHPLDPRNRKTKYAVTVNGKSICGYTMGNAKGAWAEASRWLFYRGESWNSPKKETT
jgi:hypothetical protein